jgi:hypothetical protein
MKMKLPKDFIEACKKITAKRSRTVIEHILKHGFITTEELKDTYGYNHPPRAVRDVKEQGIPIEMFRVQGKDGRRIAAYRFGDPKKSRYGKLLGRTILTKELKQKLIKKYSSRCAIYLEPFAEKDLQIDHRVPFEIAGDVSNKGLNVEDFMLLCSSANRAKSWSCEHCINWLETKNPDLCRSCYWAFPDSYTHVALQPIRRLDILWAGDEVKTYNKLHKKADKLHKDVPIYVKEIIKNVIK